MLSGTEHGRRSQAWQEVRREFMSYSLHVTANTSANTACYRFLYREEKGGVEVINVPWRHTVTR